MFYCSFILLCLCYLTVSQNILANSAASTRYVKFNEIIESGKCNILSSMCGNISDDLDALDCAFTYKVLVRFFNNALLINHKDAEFIKTLCFRSILIEYRIQLMNNVNM